VPKPSRWNFSPNATVLFGTLLQRPSEEFAAVKRSVAAQWAALDDHFRHHARLVDRFRHADLHAVARMWKSQTNEDGKRLSQFERDALIERHCELFGTWPH
jgi:glutathione S-transferase